MRRLFSIVCFNLWFLAGVAFAQEKEVVQVEIALQEKEVKAGGVAFFNVKITIDEGFHIYGFKDKPNSTSIEVVEKNYAEIIATQFPDFEEYKGTVEGSLKVKIKRDAKQGTTKLTFLVKSFPCTETYCLEQLTKEVVVEFEINGISEEDVAVEGVSKKSDVEKYLEKGVIYLFGAAFIFGFISAFTPCVLPVVPITIAFFSSGVKSTSVLSRFTVFMKALFFILGIALVYSGIGTLFAVLDIADIATVTTNKYVAFGYAFLFFILALFLFGVFKIRLPGFIASSAGKVRAAGYFGAFLRGVVCSVLFTPCTGPIAAGILALSSGGDITVGFLAMFIYTLGLGIPFLVLAFVSESVTRMIRGGKWQVVLKNVCGVLFLLAVFYFIYPHLSNADKNNTSDKNDMWYTSFEKAFEVAKKEGKPIFIDFYTKVCIACDELDEKVFPEREVQEELKRFIAVKLDVSADNEETKKNAEFKKQFKLQGVPLLVFYDSSGKHLKHLDHVGYLEKEELLKILRNIR